MKIFSKILFLILLFSFCFLIGCKECCEGHGHRAGCKNGVIICDDGFVTDCYCVDGEPIDGLKIEESVQGTIDLESIPEEFHGDSIEDDMGKYVEIIEYLKNADKDKMTGDIKYNPNSGDHEIREEIQ